MRTARFWPLLLVVLAYACGAPQSTTKSIRGTTIRPILKSWVVAVPSAGQITNVMGGSWLLDKTTNKYVELHTGSLLVPGDLLQLKKNSQITIQFKDDSRVTIDPKNYPVEGSGEDVYFTIEKKKTKPSNQAL